MSSLERLVTSGASSVKPSKAFSPLKRSGSQRSAASRGSSSQLLEDEPPAALVAMEREMLSGHGGAHADASSLPGPRSKFGDGDGSWWDRWLVVAPPAVSSFAHGPVAPRSGFKKPLPAVEKRQPSPEPEGGDDGPALAEPESSISAAVSRPSTARSVRSTLSELSEAISRSMDPAALLGPLDDEEDASSAGRPELPPGLDWADIDGDEEEDEDEEVASIAASMRTLDISVSAPSLADGTAGAGKDELEEAATLHAPAGKGSALRRLSRGTALALTWGDGRGAKGATTDAKGSSPTSSAGGSPPAGLVAGASMRRAPSGMQRRRSVLAPIADADGKRQSPMAALEAIVAAATADGGRASPTAPASPASSGGRPGSRPSSGGSVRSRAARLRDIRKRAAERKRGHPLLLEARTSSTLSGKDDGGAAEEKDSYFGLQARWKFFGKFRRIDRQQMDIDPQNRYHIRRVSTQLPPRALLSPLRTSTAGGRSKTTTAAKKKKKKGKKRVFDFAAAESKPAMVPRPQSGVSHGWRHTSLEYRYLPEPERSEEAGDRPLTVSTSAAELAMAAPSTAPAGMMRTSASVPALRWSGADALPKSPLRNDESLPSPKKRRGRGRFRSAGQRSWRPKTTTGADLFSSVAATAHAVARAADAMSDSDSEGELDGDYDGGRRDYLAAARKSLGSSRRTKKATARRPAPLPPVAKSSSLSVLTSSPLSAASAGSDDDDDGVDADGGMKTARRTFLTRCKELDVLPEPTLIRKRESTYLQLHHYGMGDAMGSALADSLEAMPLLEHLNLRDNRLTDSSLCNALKSVLQRGTLLSLDLSENRIGIRGTRLLQQLARKTKTLHTLQLSKLSMSDRLVALLSESLMGNSTVRLLDLSRNAIGLRGGQKLADLIAVNSCISELQLAWNNIRGTAAEAMGRALASNSALRKLDLSWNSFGGAGSITIGESLYRNTTLEVLLLSNNSVDSMAAMTLAGGLENNSTLRLLRLDGNRLGKKGGGYLLRAIARGGSECKVSMDDCNFDADSTSFDPARPEGSYVLRLEDARDRSIATELVRLASSKPGCSFKSIYYQTARGRVQWSFQSEGEAAGAAIPSGRGTLRDHTGRATVLPAEGQLIVAFTYRPQPAVAELAPSREGLQKLLSMLELERASTADRMRLLQMSAEEMYFMTDVAGELMHFAGSSAEKVAAMLCIAPRLVDVDNMWEFVDTWMTFEEKAALREAMGQYFTFTPSNCTGHYQLDLSDRMDVLIWARIAQTNNVERDQALRTNWRPDTSQAGNWEGTRNARLNGRPIKLTGKTRLPDSGLLEFDFVSTTRPPAGADVMDLGTWEELLEELQVTKLEALCAADAHNCRAVLTEVLTEVRLMSNQYYFSCDHLRRFAQCVPKLNLLRGIKPLAAEDIDPEVRDDHGYNAESDGPPSFDPRVELAVILFARVVDLPHYCDACRDVLTPSEFNRLRSRLGFLNFWNPLSPDGFYYLELTVHEDHLLCKALVKLAVAEPGENWIGENYNDINGWELPATWITEIPTRGWLKLTYTSDPKEGCAPHWATRRSLLSLVLMTSEDADTWM